MRSLSAGRPGQDLGHDRAAPTVDELLEIVEDQQHPPAAQVLEQLLPRPFPAPVEGKADGPGDGRGEVQAEEQREQAVLAKMRELAH